MSRATMAKHPADVAAMFDQVARRYDRTNAVLSLGLDRRWRRAVTAAVAARPGQRVLDLAAGTATSSAALASTGADVVGCDFSLGMLRIGRGRAYPRVYLTAGDALHLPFADRSFDAVTISFGLRNVADVDAALAELLRVTRPGGQLVVCEFSRPAWPPLRAAYLDGALRLVPPVARRVSSDPEAYAYLAESIRAWPERDALAARVRAAGWSGATWRNLTLGIVALHLARRPGGAP